MNEMNGLFDFNTMGPWSHVVHDLIFTIFWFWVGSRFGRRQMRKNIEKGLEDAPKVIPPEFSDWVAFYSPEDDK